MAQAWLTKCTCATQSAHWHSKSHPASTSSQPSRSRPAAQERLRSNATASTIPESVLKYADSKGWLELRAALCDLLARTTMPGLAPAPENLALSAGVGSVLDTLAFILADEGSSWLVAAPYYPMYDLDLGAKAGVHVEPARLLDCDDVVAELDAAFRRAQAASRPPRVLIITSPDNPTGVVFTEARLKAILKWCVRRKVHCVVNECYCWSVPADAPMRSALCVAADLAGELETKEEEKLWQLVHVVIGMSKDFCSSGAHPLCFVANASSSPHLSCAVPCAHGARPEWRIVADCLASPWLLQGGLDQCRCCEACMRARFSSPRRGAGLRIGGMYTYSAEVLEAYGMVAHLSAVSTLTQWHLLELLRDEAFVDHYLAEHAANAQENAGIVCDGLDAIGGIAYVRPQVRVLRTLARAFLVCGTCAGCAARACGLSVRCASHLRLVELAMLFVVTQSSGRR
jgi:aspartate/methionine/tyrosine aminotransferase